MFYKCSGLISLNLSGFGSSKVTDAQWMFLSCTSLTDLNLGNFSINETADKQKIFSQIPAAAIIKVKTVETQTWILNISASDRPSSWTTANVIIAN